MGVAVLKAQEIADHPFLPQAKEEDWRRFPLHKFLKQVGNLRTHSTLEMGSDITPQDGFSLFTCPEIDSSLQKFVRSQSDEQFALDITHSTEIHLHFAGEDQCVSLPYIQCLVRQGQTLDLHMRFDSTQQGWIAPLTEIKLEEGAKLNIIREDRSTSPALITDQIVVLADKYTETRLFNVKTGSASMRFAAHMYLEGEGAKADVTGLSLLHGASCAESVIDVRHLAANTQSNQLYHAVIAGKAQSNYIGKVYVEKSAQKTDAQQLSRNLLMGPMATQFVKPELEIYADDVQCAHGATTGDLDEEALFYLRSRGIPLTDAKATLIRAFCEAPLEMLGQNHPFKDKIQERVEQQLQEVLA